MAPRPACPLLPNLLKPHSLLAKHCYEKVRKVRICLMNGQETDWRLYSGRWFEQARIPSWFEPSSMKDSTAHYIPLDNGSIRVINEGRDVFGNMQHIEGMAQVVPRKPGTLNVTFFPPFSSEYVILSHGCDHPEAYDCAVVGVPSRNYLWLLTRTKNASQQQFNHLLKIARANGYTDHELAKLQLTPKMIRAGGYGSTTKRRHTSTTVQGPWVQNIERASSRNRFFRRVIKTGKNQQLVLMAIPPQTDIGLEVHKNVDQFLRIEKGHGRFDYGPSHNQLVSKRLAENTALFVPAGLWHNVTNTSKNQSMHLYTLYAPPEHPPALRRKYK